MRTTTIHFLLFVSALSLFSSCQELNAGRQQEGAVDIISNALKNGDASTIAIFFPNSVGISVLQKAPVYYSKTQAQQVLSDFFAKNKPRQFDKAHGGGSKDNAQFTMGDLTTSSGVYRVTFFLKTENGKAKIQNLIIDKK